jgi:hypothetical protein
LDTLLEALGRLIVQYVFGTIFQAIFYWPGWVMLRLITIGSYPPAQIENHNRTGIAWFGFTVIVMAVALDLVF